MCTQLVFIAAFSLALAGSSFAGSDHDIMPGSVVEQSPSGTDASKTAQRLFDEIVIWLSANFDLPATPHGSEIRFTSKLELARMRAAGRAHWQGLTQQEETDELVQRTVVAVYDMKLKTIFLSDDWVGRSPQDQSVLVHEIVHHLQNSAQLKFECPAAREKMAYMAQEKWLARFGTSLEDQFGIDMFTVVVTSACM
jgi:hypothetical protein